MRILYLIAVLFVFSVYMSKAYSQNVLDSAFCKKIDTRNDQVNCKGLIFNGHSISIKDLPIIDGNRAVHLWSRVDNKEGLAFDFLFSREGDCIERNNLAFNDNNERSLTVGEQIKGYLQQRTISDIWNFLDISELEIKDVKINTVRPNSNFGIRQNYHDYRYVFCAGKVRARLLNSSGDPLTGKNPVISIEITD